jgi:hypothetical protein
MQSGTIRTRTIPPLVENIAIFLSRANLSITAACCSSLRSVLISAFNEGWTARENAGSGRMMATYRHKIPKLNPSLLRAALSKVCAETRLKVIGIFAEYPFVGITIDGVTIHSRHFLNVDIVHPVSQTAPFTFDFLEQSSYRTHEFVDQFAEILYKIAEAGLRPAGVTSDGCSFQKKGLTWRDEESLQARFPDFRSLILVPCVCHRIQNSLKWLYTHNEAYRESIDAVRGLAVLLRKPKCRSQFDAICPVHCPTRWVYDFEIVKFMRDRLALIGEVCEREDLPFTDHFLSFGPLLEKVAFHVRIFESDRSGIDFVYPGICKLCHDLEEDALELPEEPAEAYRQFSMTVRRLCLNAHTGLFHLAFALTPNGRIEARTELLGRIAEIPELGPMRHEHRQHSPMASDDELDDDERQLEINRHDQIEEDVLEDDRLIDEEDAGTRELELEEEETETFDESLLDAGPFEEPEGQMRDDASVRFLYNEAERGLQELLAQMGADDSEADSTLARFQRYISMTPQEFPMREEADTARYPWIVLLRKDASWRTLADIALRLESLLCNEAVTERTNGTMRRFLSPLRMRMGHAAITARLMLAKHGNPRLDPGHTRGK